MPLVDFQNAEKSDLHSSQASSPTLSLKLLVMVIRGFHIAQSSGHFSVSVLPDLSLSFDIIDYSPSWSLWLLTYYCLLVVLCLWMLCFRNFFHWFLLIFTAYGTCSALGILSPIDITSSSTFSRDIPSLFSSYNLHTTEHGDRVDILFSLLFSIQIILFSLNFSSFESHVIRFYLLQPLIIAVDCISWFILCSDFWCLLPRIRLRHSAPQD